MEWMIAFPSYQIAEPLPLSPPLDRRTSNQYTIDCLKSLFVVLKPGRNRFLSSAVSLDHCPRR